MIDLRKIKEHCKAYGGHCSKDGELCQFSDRDSGKCLMLNIPEHYDIERIEEAYNKLFNQKNRKEIL